MISRRISLANLALFLLLLYGIFYIGNKLSPSSYGVVLEMIDAEKDGLFFGKPRPIRSDEWAVQTAFVKIAVNNNFERYNNTSIYKEDLRPVGSLPLKDWAISFKPLLWGFYFLPPNYAYSLYYFLIMVLCLVGYALFFRRLGTPSNIAIGFSLLIYFSSFVQNWWTAIGSILSFFPWIYLIIISDRPLKIRIPLFYYTTTCMVYSTFYPPLFYALAITALTFLFAFHHNILNWKNLVIFGICAILSIATYLLYIQDSILALANTVYPGNRTVDGGGVGLLQFISQFFPSILINQYNGTSLHPNVCELSVVGSYLLLTMIIFGDWKKYYQNITSEEKKSLIILSISFLMISAWMILPIPGNLVKIILLNHIPGVRLIFATGFIILGISAIILRKLKFVLSPIRITLFFCLTFGSICLQQISNIEGLIIIPLFFIFLLIHYSIYHFDQNNITKILLLLVVINNILTNIFFNPLQSTQPIFSTPQTDFIKSLQNKENFTNEGFFKLSLPGATANSLGLPSIAHVIYVPQLKFFRCYFPEIPEKEFNNIFNRYLHIDISDKIDHPMNIQPDASLLPLKRFETGSKTISTPSSPLKHPPAPPLF